MKLVVLSVAAAWYLPAAPAGRTAPAQLPAQMPAPVFRGAPAPAQVAYAYPEPVVAYDAPSASAAEVPALSACAAVAAGVLLGYGLGRRQTALAIEAEDMWWGDQDYPPSKVLGIGRDVPSLVYGPLSGLAFSIGCYCVAQSNLLNILSGSTVNGWYVAGSLLVPYSWGLHVACWIQKQNGK